MSKLRARIDVIKHYSIIKLKPTHVWLVEDVGHFGDLLRCELLFKMGQPRPLLHLFLSFQTHYKFCKKYICEKMSIQYTVPRFELMAFGT